MATPKSTQYWKHRQPSSLRAAMELCLEYARAVHNRSIERVADLMGIGSHWSLYKWLENGRLPAILIRPFESACGIDFVSRYIGYSAHKLLIDIPTGKRATQKDIHTLQTVCTDAIGSLLKFHAGEIEMDTANAVLITAMQQLAWHKGTLQRDRQPELDFNDIGSGIEG